MRHGGTSFVLALMLLYTPVISKKEIGKLYLAFDYRNPSESLIDGDRCDFLLACDVYFSICVQSTGSTPCNIYRGESRVYEDVNEINSTEMEKIVIPLNSPIGTSLEIGIDIWDYDGIDASDLIAHFDGTFQTKSLSLQWTPVPINRTDFIYLNDVTIYTVWREGIPNLSSADSRTIDLTAFRLTGPTCDQIDYCAENNCADYATCQLFTNGYKCVCGAYEGTKCEKGYDPCQPKSPCGPNGQCKAVGPDYACECLTGWGGQHCDRPDSECESPGSRCEMTDICAEEYCSGHGVCIFYSKSKVKFHCQCDTGWAGETCKYRSQSPCYKASQKLPANRSAVCLHGGECVDSPNGVDFSLSVLIGAVAFLLILVLCLWNVRKRKSREGTAPMVYTSTPLTKRSTENPANSLIMPYAIYIASNVRNARENKGDEPRVFRRPTSPIVSEQSSGPALPPRNRLLEASTSDEQLDH
ncbi:unnamed protein product [Rodentolepis nana]|uniref:Delta-like protein n=1 Tax=Rodentolepis nana TaxID=102285 RepID=A0A0R3TXX6_RODNA|nr:unnamed protein product [Rodentolepis nana]